MLELYFCALNKNNKNKIIILKVGLNPKLKFRVFENEKKRNDIKI